jgi:hypothetical protein
MLSAGTRESTGCRGGRARWRRACRYSELSGCGYSVAGESWYRANAVVFAWEQRRRCNI